MISRALSRPFTARAQCTVDCLHRLRNRIDYYFTSFLSGWWCNGTFAVAVAVRQQCPHNAIALCKTPGRRSSARIASNRRRNMRRLTMSCDWTSRRLPRIWRLIIFSCRYWLMWYYQMYRCLYIFMQLVLILYLHRDRSKFFANNQIKRTLKMFIYFYVYIFFYIIYIDNHNYYIAFYTV